MTHQFILSCCSTVDLPYSHMEERDIPVLSYTYMIDGQEYEDDSGRDPNALPWFYEQIRQGKLPTTSQISVGRYLEFLEPLVQKGDVLHIAFSSGLTGGVNNARLAAEELREKYPERKIFIADSLCASGGYGLLTDLAADLRDGGADIDTVYQWIMDNRGKIHHHFFTGDMTHFRRTGRVSGPAAAVATVLNICLMMCMDGAGKLKAYGKVRGKKAAFHAAADAMEAHAQGGLSYEGPCYLDHSMCPEDAAATVAAIEERFPQLRGKVRVNYIGPTIGAHTGIGTVSFYFVGDERKIME